MESNQVLKIVVTGSAGLLGWHACARLHATNCAARFQGGEPPFKIQPLDRATFNCDTNLKDALTDADAVLHFAGVNRASDSDLERENPEISERLVATCQSVGSKPHFIHANSTHSISDNAYGRSKKNAAEVLRKSGFAFTDIVLPHIFGECARPHYNNVTATLIDQILSDETPTINAAGGVKLLHAGEAAQIAIDAAINKKTGVIHPDHTPLSVPELYQRLQGMHDLYQSNIYPDFSSSIDVALFNTYRAATTSESWPRTLKLNTDPRGTLFEAVKGGGGGQTFLSTTNPGVTRGDHFHLGKVERFLVVQGDAVIRIRRVLHEPVRAYHVSGEKPAYVDMPTLHTHSIENVGSEPLLTLFWTHDLFDPDNPDTFADPVLT